MPTTAPQLCGSHLAFYACKHRADRGGGGNGHGPDCCPIHAGYQPGQPYRCLAPEEHYKVCDAADRYGFKHRAAGIVVPLVQASMTSCPHGVPHRWSCEKCDGGGEHAAARA